MERSMKLPHKVGDYVIYRRSGICRIEEIKDVHFDRIGAKTYYILKSVYEKQSTIYVPSDSEELVSDMRRLLDKQEIDSIILDSENCDRLWVNDQKERFQRFSELITDGNRCDILRMVKSLSLYKAEMEQSRKKFCSGDEKLLAAAEKTITEEFAFVLGIAKNEVIPYILDKIRQ